MGRGAFCGLLRGLWVQRTIPGRVGVGRPRGGARWHAGTPPGTSVFEGRGGGKRREGPRAGRYGWVDWRCAAAMGTQVAAAIPPVHRGVLGVRPADAR